MLSEVPLTPGPQFEEWEGSRSTLVEGCLSGHFFYDKLATARTGGNMSSLRRPPELALCRAAVIAKNL
jgi:hypothetical protein